jgi:hypothetical protein
MDPLKPNKNLFFFEQKQAIKAWNIIINQQGLYTKLSAGRSLWAMREREGTG